MSPASAGTDLSIWSNALIDIILFLSLGLLVRTSGQISLCHLAFAAVGAAAFGHFADSYHIPWLLALLLAVLVAVPVGALVAIPAIRLSGVFLALATFGFGILLEQMFYTTTFMFGPTTSGIPAPRPDVSIGSWHLATDTGFYYVLLIFTVLTVVVIIGHPARAGWAACSGRWRTRRSPSRPTGPPPTSCGCSSSASRPRSPASPGP